VWSVAATTAGTFWREMADYAGISWRRPPAADLEAASDRVTGYRWFRDGQLNYAERALRPPPNGSGSVAVVARSQTRPPSQLTWAELSDLVARVRTGLLAADVGVGDRVAGYLPNVPEALAAMLACATIGAIWTSCAPEMGVTGVVDRFSQVEPAVLLSVDGYRYGSRAVDRRAEAESVRGQLPSVRKAVWLPYLETGAGAPPGWANWADFVANVVPLDFAALDFDHPLYILFSSGTTGKPKPIVHGHGGILLEHAKALRLHFDLGPGDRFLWFSTTGWMMWNFCVSGLLAGSAVVLFDGDPNWPEAGSFWGLVESTGTTCAGLGAGYLVANMKAGLYPSTSYNLGSLKTLGSTGSPLPASAAEWVYGAVGDDLMLASFSGGTDVCTGFLGPSPLHPVWAGEISCPCLGAKVEVFDDEGRPVVGQEGELVLTAPLPSMPVRFWADDGSRYRAAYFDRFPGVWAHGDRAVLTDRGTFVITGRSDGTLNRGGVRMGTAEFYSVVEGFPDVVDSLVVHLDDPTGGPGELWLFVVEQGGGAEIEGLAGEIKAALRQELSPRYVPDRVIKVTAVPRTLSGKKLEVPVKRLLSGTALADALALTSVANPESLEPFLNLRQERLKYEEGRAGER
jgi:acetoacetyl-CoA synthetase